MVTAPSATSSSSVIGELFAPQLSDPTKRKWPVRLARRAASRTRLPGREESCYQTKKKLISGDGKQRNWSVVSLFLYLMSSSLAKMITPLALLVSIRRLMILSNSPDVGSRGIFTDWAIHTPPDRETNRFTERQTGNTHWQAGSLIDRQDRLEQTRIWTYQPLWRSAWRRRLHSLHSFPQMPVWRHSSSPEL